MNALMMFATYAGYALVCYLPIAYVLRLILNYRAREVFKSDDLILGGNHAVALRRGGAHLGLAIAMIGVASGQASTNLALDMAAMFAYGLMAAAFMLTSLMVTDKLILPGVNNNAELAEGNLAVGTVEFGAMVMTGIVAYAAIHGDGGSPLASVIYFVAGQLLLVLLTLGYEKVFQGRELVTRINRGELASGIYLSAKLIAYGLIMQAAIIGPVAGSHAGAALEFAITAVGGLALLFVFEWLVDWLIVTSTKVDDIIRQNQISAAIQLSLPKVGFALFLGVAML